MTNLNNENEIEQIGLQLWKYLSGCIGHEVGYPVSWKDLQDFQIHNFYKQEQVTKAMSWCIKQKYFEYKHNKDDTITVKLIKAYQ